MNIAAIITCHNRKEKTLLCLNSLLKNISSVKIYLTDDNSSDGTSYEIKKRFPQVHIIHGDGHLYWSRGMHIAWEKALQEDFDYYLWLNDDVVLYPCALQELHECARLFSNPCIISGIITDRNGNVIYGGYKKNKQLVLPDIFPQPICYMNGNAVLIPREVVKEIGIIDPHFHHDLGDLDYGLRAQEAGFPVYASRIPIGVGEANPIHRERKWKVGLFRRFQVLYSPLGSPPHLNFYYRKRHFGYFHAIAYWLYQHAINLFPDSIYKKYRKE